MAETEDYYAILQVSEDADAEAIRRQFRQMVKRHHPDVSVDRIGSHAQFTHIVRAYEVLSDPVRRSLYDQSRRPKPSPISATAPAGETVGASRTAVDALLVTAELHLIRGEYENAIAQANRVRKADPSNARAYALLGDIYQEMQNYGDAVVMYTYAAQFDPRNPVYQRKLEWLVQRDIAQQRDSDREHIRSTPPSATPAAPAAGVTIPRIAYAVLMFVGICLTVLHLHHAPGAPLFSVVPRNLIFYGAAAGAMLGSGASALQWWERFNDELVGDALARPGTAASVEYGLGILFTGLICFYLSLVFFVIVSAINDDWSPTMIMMFVSCTALTAALAFALPDGRNLAMAVGGNAVFLGTMIGWSVTDMAR